MSFIERFNFEKERTEIEAVCRQTIPDVNDAFSKKINRTTELLQKMLVNLVWVPSCGSEMQLKEVTSLYSCRSKY